MRWARILPIDKASAPAFKALRPADSAPCIQTVSDNPAFGNFRGGFSDFNFKIERRKIEARQRYRPLNYFLAEII